MSFEYVMNNPNNYLCHHGLLGQKWGVRRYQNKDGSLTSKGKLHREEAFKDVVRITTRNEWRKDISDEVFDKMGLNKNVLAKARADISNSNNDLDRITKETNDLFKEFNDEETKDQYTAIAQLASALNDNWRTSESMTCSELANIISFSVFDDDEGQAIEPINAYTAYAVDNNISDKADRLSKEYYSSYSNMEDNCTKLINSEMSKLGDISAYNEDLEKNESVKQIVNKLSGRMMRANVPYTSKSIAQLEKMPIANTEKGRNNIAEAKSIISNLGTNKEDRWYYIENVIPRLGYSDKPISDLTSSDWNKINVALDREIELDKDPELNRPLKDYAKNR